MSESKKTTSRFELLIFDWDGTISDSLDHIVRSMRYAISKLDFPNRDNDAIRDIIGLGLEEALERLFPGIDAEQSRNIVQHYRGYYLSATAENTNLFPDVEQTIKLLHGVGYNLAVATGKSRRGLDRALEESGLDGYFHCSRCADETISKPHPRMLEEIMDIFTTRADRVLMIGDSEHDLQMAKNAGVASAAVTYGAQNIDYLQQFEPLTYFNSLCELPQWLQSVND